MAPMGGVSMSVGAVAFDLLAWIGVLTHSRPGMRRMLRGGVHAAAPLKKRGGPSTAPPLMRIRFRQLPDTRRPHGLYQPPLP